MGDNLRPATDSNSELVGTKGLTNVAADFGEGASTGEAEPDIADGDRAESSIGLAKGY